MYLGVKGLFDDFSLHAFENLATLQELLDIIE